MFSRTGMVRALRALTKSLFARGRKRKTRSAIVSCQALESRSLPSGAAVAVAARSIDGTGNNLAHPDWGAAARGLVVPSMPLTRDAVLIATATIGTTLAPWALSFIQSYAVDKKLTEDDLG